MKMDIEGFEYEAILGSPEVFRRRQVTTIALELHRSRIAARGLDPDAVTRFLQECGYACTSTGDNTYYVWTCAA